MNGFAHEWSASGKVYATVKKYWHKVNHRRSVLLEKARKREVA